MNFDTIRKEAGDYYGGKLREYGPTPQGVDWNSKQSQDVRFEQVLKVCDRSEPFTLNDYGCGYGALAEYITQQGCHCRYHGFDVSPLMVAEASRIHVGEAWCEFFSDETRLTPSDYTVASGVFNVKQQVKASEWLEYVISVVDHMAEVSQNGFAFNALTKYSDPDHMRADLYYADPCFFFDYCKRKFSRRVALLHDYGLYEFTIIVRLSGEKGH